jgi:hypothetical protein
MTMADHTIRREGRFEGAPTEPAAFVRWAEGREGRFELSRGQTTMMVGATIRHELMVSNLVVLLRAELRMPASICPCSASTFGSPTSMPGCPADVASVFRTGRAFGFADGREGS